MMFLSFEDVFNYLEAVPSSQCVREGQAVLNANHLIMVGATEKSATKVLLFALCLKTSGLRESPHEIKGTLLVSGNLVSINDCGCSCKAGRSGRCKHIAALLFYCTRSNISDIDLLSSTDIECHWKKEKSQALKAYDPVPLLETKEVKEIKSYGKVNKLLHLHISKEEEAKILDGFLLVAPNSSISKHKTVRKFDIINAAVPDVVINVMAWTNQSKILLNLPIVEPANECCSISFTNLKTGDFTKIAFETIQNKSLWCSERQFRVTGSRCYSLFTYSKDDWQLKSRKYFWPKSFTNKYVQHGNDSEQEARECYKRQNNCDLLQVGLVISKKHPWLGYSPNGVVMNNGQPLKLLEIKCPFLGKTKGITEAISSCDYLITEPGGAVQLKKNINIMDKFNWGWCC